jgi:hypothetical protein
LADQLTDIERRNLAAIMARATGSTFDHERLTALSLAHQMLTQRGFLWSDVLHAAPDPSQQSTHQALRTYRDYACEYLQTDVATTWEENFLTSIAIKSRAGLAPKQDATLRDIADKFGVPLWGMP